MLNWPGTGREKGPVHTSIESQVTTPPPAHHASKSDHTGSVESGDSQNVKVSEQLHIFERSRWAIAVGGQPDEKLMLHSLQPRKM